MKNSIITLLLIISVILLLGCGSQKAFSTGEHTLAKGYTVLNQPMTFEKFIRTKNNTVGVLVLPSLSSELAIIEEDAMDLKKGVSISSYSPYPSQGGEITLTVNQNSLIKRARNLKVGDVLIVNLPYGSFNYQITKIDTKHQPSNTQGETLTFIVPSENKTTYFYAIPISTN
ncbi:sortase family protein [Litchfieldia alkalitelluris]|uniref:hypothetical protein n=1 Tax=Litchfieldia alkalitelluris TaxID=304268 RepID=UPI000996C596|nr:hypothetical protein [Litchfieldia alkalitelluris]